MTKFQSSAPMFFGPPRGLHDGFTVTAEVYDKLKELCGMHTGPATYFEGIPYIVGYCTCAAFATNGWCLHRKADMMPDIREILKRYLGLATSCSHGRKRFTISQGWTCTDCGEKLP